MDAGVDCGRKWFDGPCWVNRVDPNVQCIQFLQRKHFIPRRTQLEKALSSVLINLKTQDIAWSTTSSGSTELPNQIYLNKTFPTLQNFIRSTLYWVHRGREQTALKSKQTQTSESTFSVVAKIWKLNKNNCTFSKTHINEAIRFLANTARYSPPIFFTMESTKYKTGSFSVVGAWSDRKLRSLENNRGEIQHSKQISQIN